MTKELHFADTLVSIKELLKTLPLATVSSLKIHSTLPNFDIYLESNYHKTISCRNNKKLNCVEIVL